MTNAVEHATAPIRVTLGLAPRCRSLKVVTAWDRNPVARTPIRLSEMDDACGSRAVALVAVFIAVLHRAG